MTVGAVWSYALDGSPDAAIAQLEPYVQTHPDDTAAARALGDLYFRTGNLDHAETIWEADTKRHPDDHATHERLGGLLAARGRLNEALREFEASLPFRGALLRLVELHRRTNTLNDFVIASQQRVRDNPNDPEAWLLYGIVLQSLHHADDALQYYARAVVLSNESQRCSALVGRAVDLTELDRPGDARSDLQACLRIDAKNYGALEVMGATYIHENNAVQARSWLERALALQPDGVEALIDLGYLDDASGNRDRAMQRYRTASALDPTRPEGYINLGYDDEATGNAPAAETVLLSGLVADPDNGRLHYLLGNAYENEGKLEPAQAQYQAATSSDEPAVVQAARAALQALEKRPKGIG
ncbi:MAG: tetratricopeptide repeat protein [Candidatus Lustribacter sp.]